MVKVSKTKMLDDCVIATCVGGHANGVSLEWNWQPIETLKQNGKEVLLLEDRGFIVIGKWDNDFDSPTCREYMEVEATHWMPLPPIPEEEDATDG